ncbi:MAG TPA: cytochrome c oxidase assembly protein [Solirubrobacteraceae bacterium]|jgi:cytochrome c oxidase assembly factor CtaG
MSLAAAPGLGRILSEWTFDPGLVCALVASALLYVLAVRRARRRWPAARSLSFLAGLAVIAVALLSGVDGYADSLLSIHMAQHMLLVMVAPVLLAWGAPVRLALAASPRRGRRRIAAVLRVAPVHAALHPLVGSVIVCALSLGTCFTGLFALTLRNATVHELEHAALLLGGLVLFVPLVAADPLPRPPTALARLCSLTLVMTAMVVVGAVLSFQGSVRYAHYAATARAMHISALGDQQLGGVVMWFGGGLLGALLTVALVGEALFVEERRQRRRDLYAAVPTATGQGGGTGR